MLIVDNIAGLMKSYCTVEVLAALFWSVFSSTLSTTLKHLGALYKKQGKLEASQTIEDFANRSRNRSVSIYAASHLLSVCHDFLCQDFSLFPRVSDLDLTLCWLMRNHNICVKRG